MGYNNADIEKYASALARVASLSNLFSESKTPYLHYRTTEYLFSRAFSADNLARSDIAIDAKLGNVGVGIKTFTYSGKPKYEKIAEFNKKLGDYAGLPDEEKIKKIAEMRNDRIDFAGNLTGATTFIYHCIARLPEKLFVFEDEMPHIDIGKIVITSKTAGSINFTDGRSKYRFNTSKSTLFKEFFGERSLFEKPVVIYDDPFALLESYEFKEQTTELGDIPEVSEEEEFVILPLYGYRAGHEKFVFEKSGLNQWNAGGRERKLEEVYIPIPVAVRNAHPSFFPDRDTPFTLHLPNGKTMSVKVCQDDGKALMSDPNIELGEWLLRSVLNVPEETPVTYEMLESVGVDSVEISIRDGKYYIDFKEIGSYEKFIKPDSVEEESGDES